MAFGIKQKRSIDDVQLPYFTDEEQVQNDDIIHFLDNYSVLNDEKLFDEPSMVYSSAATSVPQFTGMISNPTHISQVFLHGSSINFANLSIVLSSYFSIFLSDNRVRVRLCCNLNVCHRFL